MRARAAALLLLAACSPGPESASSSSAAGSSSGAAASSTSGATSGSGASTGSSGATGSAGSTGPACSGSGSGSGSSGGAAFSPAFASTRVEPTPTGLAIHQTDTVCLPTEPRANIYFDLYVSSSDGGALTPGLYRVDAGQVSGSLSHHWPGVDWSVVEGTVTLDEIRDGGVVTRSLDGESRQLLFVRGSYDLRLGDACGGQVAGQLSFQTYCPEQ